MKNKNFLPALTLFAFVWILGFVVSKVLHLIGISWWWILLPLPVVVVIYIVIEFFIEKGVIKSRGLLRSRKIGKKTAFCVILAFIITLVLMIYIPALYTGNSNTNAFYYRGRAVLENTLADYKDTQNQEFPIIYDQPVSVNGSEVVQSESYYVVAMCPLLTLNVDDSWWFHTTEMCHAENCAAGGDNLDGCTGCNGSYLWLTTMNGDIASICIGAECEAHGEDGFQGVYP